MSVLKRAGFTLIELLVVLVIIGIMSAAVLVRHANLNNFKKIIALSTQLKLQMELVREQAIFQMRTLGLKIEKSHYRFYSQLLNGKKKWIPYPDSDSFWRDYSIDTNMQIDLQTKEKFSPADPQIIFIPDGNMTAFTLNIHFKNQSRSIILTGKTNGSISLRESP